MLKLVFLMPILIWGSLGKALGQCTVSKDAYGQVVTTCQFDENTSYLSGSYSSVNKQVTFLGSQFSSFPVWQQGQIRLDQSSQVISCQLTYNIFTQEVQCRFEGDLTVNSVTPDWFLINGVEYNRQHTNVLGLTYTLYTTTLNRGQTKLLKSTKARLVKTPFRNSYDRSLRFDGHYKVEEQYYLQKDNAAPQPINLTRKSLSNVLGNQQENTEARLDKQLLNVDQVIKLINRYDSLRIVNSTSLSTDSIFNELLWSDLKYPVQAWQAQVYARVYVGFEITDSGQVANIQLLSPENVGFGFKQEVEKTIGKLSTTKPAYRGHYALPVTFMYSYTPEKDQRSIPVNRLSDEQLAGRTLLNEVVVNQILGKDQAKSREVWGYYQ